jgi:hypothetical protein
MGVPLSGEGAMGQTNVGPAGGVLLWGFKGDGLTPDNLWTTRWYHE